MKKGQLLVDWEGLARERGHKDGAAMLRYMYVTLHLSTTAIGSALNVHATTVRNKLRDLNIPRRPKGGANFKGV